MTPILEAKDLVKRFGDITAVDGVSLAVERGEIFSPLVAFGALVLVADWVAPPTPRASCGATP